MITKMITIRSSCLLAFVSLLLACLLGSCGADQSRVTTDEYPPFPRTLGAALDWIGQFKDPPVGVLLFVDSATQEECDRELPRLIALLQLGVYEPGDESEPIRFIWGASPQKAAHLLVKEISIGNWEGVANSGRSRYQLDSVWDDADLSTAALPLLLGELGNPRKDVRRGVLLALPRLSIDSRLFIEHIIGLVTTAPDPELRRYACTALAESKACNRKFTALRVALLDRDKGVREIASTALFEYLLPAGKLLHARISLRSPYADQRRIATRYLPRCCKDHPTELLPLLKLSVLDSNATVRRQSALSLGYVGKSAAALHLLLTLSHDEDREVRSHAFQSMIEYGRPAVLELLRAMEERPGERMIHVRCLGRIGEEAHEAIPVLRRIARTTTDEALAKKACWSIRAIEK